MAQVADDDLRRYGEIAGIAAKCTRAILAEGRSTRTRPLSQIGRDIKLDEDRRSEAEIRRFLSMETGLPVLGEEMGWQGEPASPAGSYWVVDPLDGSFNYFRGIPLYAVAIALCRGRDPLVGAIFDPERDELFSGGPTLGFAVNGKAGASAGVRRQILATGFPSQADVAATSARVAAHAQEWTKMRMFGSAALSLAWVAAGRLDGYAETDVMWWDVAAGLALARGAGVPEITVVPRAGHAVEVLVAR